MGMNKIGIHRVWGIVIALLIMITAFILFNVMTYLKMDRQIQELEQIAMTYNTNYKIYLETSGNLRNYNKQISQKAYELDELERIMQNIAMNFQKTDSKITFSGIV